MPLSAHDWHRRFSIQSRWTLETRRYLYARLGELSSKKILDVGCGTGALSEELFQLSGISAVGIDLNYKFLGIASKNNPSGSFLLGDAHSSPFNSSVFDVCLCHYLLLWVDNPVGVISEMKRVTKSGGAILVLAEPDYGGRIDFPTELEILRDWQMDSLKTQGAHPSIGRELRSILNQSGIQEIEAGVIGAQWKGNPSQEEINSEWEIIQSDLEHLRKTPELVQASEDVRKMDLSAWLSGDRVLYVPTFYAWGKVVK